MELRQQNNDLQILLETIINNSEHDLQ